MEPFEHSAQQTDRDDWSKHWDSYADTASQNPAVRMRRELILFAISRIPGQIDLLIDIGSGQGDFLRSAANCHVARRLAGFELSETGVTISRAKVPEATFIQADLLNASTALSNYAEKADAIVCSEVIEHVDNPTGFLQALKKYLKSGGWLILTVPGGPMSAFDKHIGHRKHFDTESIAAVLRSAGFSIEKIQLAGFPFFNLYRLAVVLRGKKLIEDAGAGTNHGHPNALAMLGMRVFRLLFRFNVDNSLFGWQVLAVARKTEP
jgi:SAM-dependent methyltransferase